MKLRVQVTLTAMLAVSACSTTGVAVTDQQAQQFAVGKATINDVEARLGTPTDSIVNSDGTQTISYKQEKNQSDPMAFVPIAGMFSYGSKTDSHEVFFIFNRSGTLMSYRTENHTS